jgi:hypothetical protein
MYDFIDHGKFHVCIAEDEKLIGPFLGLIVMSH